MRIDLSTLTEEQVAIFDAGYKAGYVAEPVRPDNFAPPEERFFFNIQITDGCWYWLGAKSKKGYGSIGVNRKKQYAHRYSYFLAYGEYPTPIGRHICDNPSCVRPNHIIPGTHADNIQDTFERGRRPFGEDVTSAKFTNTQIREIKRLLGEGIGMTAISRMFSCPLSNVASIKYGRTYKQIN